MELNVVNSRNNVPNRAVLVMFYSIVVYLDLSSIRWEWGNVM